MRDAFVGFQIYLFVFDTAPKTFDENVIDPTTFPIHIDSNMVLLEHARERVGRELASLVGVESLRRAVALSLLLLPFSLPIVSRNNLVLCKC